MNVKLLKTWVAIVALAATSAAAAQGAGKNAEATPAKGSTSTKGAVSTKGATPQNAGAASTSTVDQIPERVRMSVATFLEGHKWFREYDDDGAGKLHQGKNRRAPRSRRNTGSKADGLLCQGRPDHDEANPLVTLWATHSDLQAVIEFLPAENGAQRINVNRLQDRRGTTWIARVKLTANIRRLPELELLRAKRRQALGRANS